MGERILIEPQQFYTDAVGQRAHPSFIKLRLNQGEELSSRGLRRARQRLSPISQSRSLASKLPSVSAAQSQCREGHRRRLRYAQRGSRRRGACLGSLILEAHVWPARMFNFAQTGRGNGV